MAPEIAPGAAFFDLDKTIISKSSTLAFGAPLYKAGFLNRRMLAGAAIANLVYKMVGADHDQLEKVRDQLTNLTKGWDQREIEELVEETVHDVVAPLVYADALAIIAEHRRAGRQVVIISSSPYEVVRPLAEYLGVEEVIATRSRIGSDGKYTGELDFYAYAEGKAEAMREMAERDHISLEDSYAYSDSATDLPMLEAVGHPIVVNPNKELREIAEERDWQIMKFVTEVNLRSRLSELPRPSPTVATAAGMIGAAIVFVAMRSKNRASSLRTTPANKIS
jgi:HAD superfamily hydrolase (TIGR01490 family)